MRRGGAGLGCLGGFERARDLGCDPEFDLGTGRVVGGHEDALAGFAKVIRSIGDGDLGGPAGRDGALFRLCDRTAAGGEDVLNDQIFAAAVAEFEGAGIL